MVPRPEVEIKSEMEIVELGTIEHFVGNIAVIKANTSGEYEVLDTGSVLCLEDRTVIAALADVIAAVREPRYTAGFANEEEIKAFGLEIGTKVFYPPALASLGFTQVLKANKGTDASNWHDEEVAEDEIEFSDDEKEAEHKRQLKAKKRGARGGRDGTAGRGGRNDSTTAGASATSNELRYDDNDNDEDGPYRPLARPMGFGQSQPPYGGNESSSSFPSHSGSYRGNRGDVRGRGNRGRGGRGNRGGNARGGYSLPPRPQGQDSQGANFQQPPAQQYNLPPVLPTPVSGQPYPAFQPLQPNGQQQFTFPWPQNPQPGFYPPPPPQFTGQPGSNGIYFNPNLLAALQNQVQSQQNQQTNQWAGQQGQHGQHGQHNQWPGQGGHS
ncbi:Gar1/Naf1 RNA binding region-domain-containing protein [Xylaria arbuscula]|nr:Gar1/Naf1 RNA binding region-domain-containing protein [Xylaria arbuscula]